MPCALIKMSIEKYGLIPWPESQDYMDKEWFSEEAVSHTDSGAYFIPFNRLGIAENSSLNWSIEDVNAQLSELELNDALITISDDEKLETLNDFFTENQSYLIELINIKLMDRLDELYGR